jgi:hypothetical protein
MGHRPHISGRVGVDNHLMSRRLSRSCKARVEDSNLISKDELNPQLYKKIEQSKIIKKSRVVHNATSPAIPTFLVIKSL